MNYIMSDDGFFSFGVASVFNSAGEDIIAVPFDPKLWQQQLDTVERGDVLLLAIDCMQIVRQILQYLSVREIKICLFVNNACGYEYFTGHNGMVSRNIPPLMTIAAVQRAVNKNALRRITEKLTPSERLIMDNLSNGFSVSRIAKNLNVTEKNVYRHKTKAMHRMGICKLRSKAIVIYGCIRQHVPVSN